LATSSAVSKPLEVGFAKGLGQRVPVPGGHEDAGLAGQDEPDEQGRFDAYDSERVVCSFCTVMVVGHPDFREPK